MEWKYLDDNTDPAAGSEDRTSWTAEDFDDSAWKTAAGPFGSKRGEAELESGYTANTVLNGCDGSNDYYAYFFRHHLQHSLPGGDDQAGGHPPARRRRDRVHQRGPRGRL